MNHRYAYCSKDQDLDQDNEEMLLTAGPGNIIMGRLADETPPPVDDTQTPHSFLSDSSLDGTGEALKMEEEEEDKEASDGQEEEARLGDEHLSSSGAVKELEGGDAQEPHSGENGFENEESESAERQFSGGDNQDSSGDLDKCEENGDKTDSARVKT